MAGLARVKISKGLFLILSLLCLVHIATSLMDKDTLTILKQRFQKATEHLKKLKADYEKRLADASKEHNESIKQLAAIEEMVNEMSDDFPPLLVMLDIIKRFTENAEAYTDKKNQEFAVRLKEGKMKLEELRNLAKVKHQVEL